MKFQDASIHIRFVMLKKIGGNKTEYHKPIYLKKVTLNSKTATRFPNFDKNGDMSQRFWLCETKFVTLDNLFGTVTQKSNSLHKNFSTLRKVVIHLTKLSGLWGKLSILSQKFSALWDKMVFNLKKTLGTVSQSVILALKLSTMWDKNVISLKQILSVSSALW